MPSTTNAKGLPRIRLVAGLLALTGCTVAPLPPGTGTPSEPAVKQDATPPVWTPAPLPEGKLLLMHYMPWYETPAVRGAWGSHWKGPQSQHHPDQLGPDGRPDIWSHYHPLIEPYDSSDPDALECQLLHTGCRGRWSVTFFT